MSVAFKFEVTSQNEALQESEVIFFAPNLADPKLFFNFLTTP